MLYVTLKEARKRVSFFCLLMVKLVEFLLEEYNLRICFVGDIVASSGRRAVKSILPGFLKDNKIDICIANAENSLHGLGVSPKIIDELINSGVDAITLGNHTFSGSDFIRVASNYSNVVVPANVSSKWPGNRFAIIDKKGIKIAIINLLGQVDMGMFCDSPFEKAQELINEVGKFSPEAIFVDFHAEATSEKQAMGYYLDGKVSVVVGTHTHVQTADNRVLPNGTGYISDAGMSGACESVIGMDIDTSLRRFVDKLPAKYQPAEGDAFMSGIIADVDYNGRCTKISRFCEYE